MALLAGFHTFDYARHFLSCCSRMLGLEHIASRGSIMLEYYGRNVGVKIMPTGVNPDRFRRGFQWEDTKWRQGELVSQVGPQQTHPCQLNCIVGERNGRRDVTRPWSYSACHRRRSGDEGVLWELSCSSPARRC